VRPCLSCGRPTPKTRCPECAREQERSRRPSYRARGYDAEYQRNRKLLLAQYPTCAICGNAAATTADHIVPRSEGGSNDIANLRPACAKCNYGRGSRKARR
jgi:5-methylcytosine-specific restriction enzyme A